MGIRLVLFSSSSTLSRYFHQQYSHTRKIQHIPGIPSQVSDIQGSIYRISSQACAGESSRSGTANVLRNALIWKSRSSTCPVRTLPHTEWNTVHGYDCSGQRGKFVSTTFSVLLSLNLLRHLHRSIVSIHPIHPHIEASDRANMTNQQRTPALWYS